MPDDSGSAGDAIARRAQIERTAEQIADEALRDVLRNVEDEDNGISALLTIAVILALWTDSTMRSADRRARRGSNPATAGLLAQNLLAEDMPLWVPADVYQTIADLKALAARNGWSDAALRDAIRRALIVGGVAAADAPALTGLGLNPNGRQLFAESIPSPDAMADVLSARSAAWRQRLRAQAQAAATATNSVLSVQAITFDGYQYKMWQSLRDDRVRDEHIDADGQVTLPDQPFIVGGEPMMYPGDRSASIELWINCRCLLLGTNSL